MKKKFYIDSSGNHFTSIASVTQCAVSFLICVCVLCVMAKYDDSASFSACAMYRIGLIQ